MSRDQQSSSLQIWQSPLPYPFQLHQVSYHPFSAPKILLTFLHSISLLKCWQLLSDMIVPHLIKPLLLSCLNIPPCVSASDQSTCHPCDSLSIYKEVAHIILIGLRSGLWFLKYFLQFLKKKYKMWERCIKEQSRHGPRSRPWIKLYPSAR